MPTLEFPADFVWGTATAAYQIEGSPLADGAGASIWHTFSHEPGRIENADTGDVACDHYNRWGEDIELMSRLGIGAYRFSISWPRILPGGRGDVNPAGLDFYDRLVDGLLDAGIRPFVTLYHWDLPQAVEDAGGWPNRECAAWYADYADIVFERLGDRVEDWITFNEPWVFCYLGYGIGFHAPGTASEADAFAAAHTMLLGHGMAVERLRARRPRARVGITLSVSPHVGDDDAAGADAAVRNGEAFHHGWFMDPLTGKDYPPALRECFGASVPPIAAADSKVISAPIDFVGLNYYTRSLVAADPSGHLGGRAVHPPGHYTAMGFEIYPAGLYRVLKDFHDSYQLPLYVTENGAGLENEAIGPDGTVADTTRLRYLQSHMEMAQRAICEGVDLRGYFVWSFMDNFEWTFGYAKRFGIVHCDFETGLRTPKLSARWFSRVIAENGI